MSISEDLITISENVKKVFEAGKKEEHDAFWDAYQDNGNKRYYSSAFYEWPDAAFYPKYDIIPSGNSSSVVANMFYGAKINDLAGRLNECGVVLDLSQVTRLGNTFYKCTSKSLPVIDMANCTSVASAFYGMSNLTDLTIVNLRADCIFSSAFVQDEALTNLSITGVIGQNGFDVSSCPLTVDSLLNILNCLSENGAGKTVTLGSTNLEKLTDSEKAIATGKGWALA